VDSDFADFHQQRSPESEKSDSADGDYEPDEEEAVKESQEDESLDLQLAASPTYASESASDLPTLHEHQGELTASETPEKSEEEMEEIPPTAGMDQCMLPCCHAPPLIPSPLPHPMLVARIC
jgi:hypothetical protein